MSIANKTCMTLTILIHRLLFVLLLLRGGGDRTHASATRALISFSALKNLQSPFFFLPIGFLLLSAYRQTS